MGNSAGVRRGVVGLWCGVALVASIEVRGHSEADCILEAGSDYISVCSGSATLHQGVFHGAGNDASASASCDAGYGSSGLGGWTNGDHLDSTSEINDAVTAGLPRGYMCSDFAAPGGTTADPTCSAGFGTVGGEIDHTSITTGNVCRTDDRSRSAHSVRGILTLGDTQDPKYRVQCQYRAAQPCTEIEGWSLGDDEEEEDEDELDQTTEPGERFQFSVGAGYCVPETDGVPVANGVNAQNVCESVGWCAQGVSTNGGPAGPPWSRPRLTTGDGDCRSGYTLHRGTWHAAQDGLLSLVIEGGIDLEDMTAEQARIVALLAGMPANARAFDPTVFDPDATISRVNDLLSEVRRYACLGGLTTFFGDLRGRGVLWEVPVPGVPWWLDFFVPRAYGFFSSGFSVAALIPILKDILGVDMKQLAATIKQLCHQRALEAAAQGTAILVGDVLRQVSGQAAGWSAGTAFDPTGLDDSASLYEAFERVLPTVFTGNLSETLNRQFYFQTQNAKALLAAQERIFGLEVSELDGVGVEDDFTITPYESADVQASCSDPTHTTQAACTAAGETWMESRTLGDVRTGAEGQAAWYPFNEGDEVGADAALDEYVGDFDLDATMGEDVMEVTEADQLLEAGRELLGTVPGSCIARQAEPTGEDAEGVTGAFRRLGYYANFRIRNSDMGRFICGLIPNVSAGTPEQICFGSADSALFGLGTLSQPTLGGSDEVYTQDLSGVGVEQLCIYGGTAPGYAAAVWGAVQVLLYVWAAWAIWGMWVRRE